MEEKESFETLAKINEAFVDDRGRPLKNIRWYYQCSMISVWLSLSMVLGQSFNVILRS